MLNLINQIVARAKADRQRIVLPEGTEERTLKAANQILTDEVADLILLGKPAEINELAVKWGLGNISKATIIDPETSPKHEEYAQLLCELRKKKGMTIEEARQLTNDPLFYGCLMIKSGDADGQLAGARNTTGNVLRPALQIIKTAPGITCVSGAMLLLTHAPEYGKNGILVMGDVAVTPVPDPNQLAQIAVCTAQTAKAVAGIENPKVAMLSFSTKGSAKHEVVDKVVEATKIAKEMAPTLDLDGEMQADAALVPEVGASKAPGSPVAGEANVLIVPSLEVGNISYKLVQRLGHADAIGPILQGIARPVNDLSRGCSIEDVYRMIAITANQAIAAKTINKYQVLSIKDNMKILVLNCGSSSIKYKLFDMTTKEVIAQGGIEKIGLKGSFLKLTLPNGEKKVLEKDIPEHTIGVEFILNTLISPEYGAIKSLDEINAVGHRMVHGGERFSESVLLNKEVLEAFAACNDLAPLHNPANLKGVNAVSAILPNIPQVGVFDTAFHQTMPDYAYMYAIPYEMYEKYGVRRYGFHGTSHRYVSKRVCEFLGVNPVGQKIITCHIGNGGSIAAIKDGKCIDTTMGLTPLEGLMMGTRSGDIDAGAVTFIMEKEGLNTTGISNLLNKKSGVLGISGVSSDMRELLAACANGNERAILAEKMYYYRIKKYIGAYAAALGGVDIILFTGGVGENQFECRESVCKDMEFMGIKLDNNVNAKVRGEEAIISTADSKVKVVVIPTDEELLIASDTMDILKK